MASKRMQDIHQATDNTKLYALNEAIKVVQNAWKRTNFVESVDVAVRLGVDVKKSDQVVRGAAVLPHGTGKVKRIAVFVEDANAVAEAQEAGADIVSGGELIEDIQAGKIEFDVLVTMPNMMAKLAKVGQKLGPKGLMPNPKTGTVTTNIGAAVAQIKKGQVAFRTDKAGIVHCGVGRITFSAEQLNENIKALIGELVALKPASAKGVYIKNMRVSSTMGGSVAVNTASL